MSSNTSEPLPNKYDNPSTTVRKTSGDLYETKKALVTTTDTIVKEGSNDKGKRPNVVREAINPTIEKRILTRLKKTKKSQASNKTVDTPRRNKYDKGK